MTYAAITIVIVLFVLAIVCDRAFASIDRRVRRIEIVLHDARCEFPPDSPRHVLTDLMDAVGALELLAAQKGISMPDVAVPGQGSAAA